MDISERSKILMKKYFGQFIIFLILLNHPVLAANVRSDLQHIETPVISQPQIKIIPQNSQSGKSLDYASVSSANSLKSAIEKIEKIQPPLKIGTSTDVSIYKKISLQEAIDYALSNNPDIIGNRLNINIAKNNIKTANRLQNPYSTFFYNAGKAAEDNPNFIALMLPIEILKRGPRKKLAQANLELTKGTTALAELNLRLDVRQAYVDLVAAKSMMKILDAQRQLLQDLLNIAQRKYEVGTVPQMDVINAKMTLNQLLIQLNSARTDILIARFKFNSLLYSNDFDTKEDYLPIQKEFIDLLTPLPHEKMPSVNEIENISIAKRLDIKNAQRDIDVAKKNLVVVARKRIPDFEIGGGYMFVPNTLATAGRTTQGVCILGNINNLPLLYQYSPEIKNAQIQVQQKELAYNNIKHQALMNVHSAYDSFNTAQINLNYYNDILLSESGQFLHMAKKSYEVGKTNMINFIYVEQSYRNIMMGYTNALANYYNAWVNLLREVNDEGLKLNG